MHRSGTDEEVTEKGQLLQELSDIYAEKDVAVQRRAEANANERQLAVQACDMVCVALGQKNATEPSNKRKPTAAEQVLEYLHTKYTNDHALKQEELALAANKHREEKKQQEERLALERESALISVSSIRHLSRTSH